LYFFFWKLWLTFALTESPHGRGTRGA
jgi:hypothetical protein